MRYSFIVKWVSFIIGLDTRYQVLGGYLSGNVIVRGEDGGGCTRREKGLGER
jgi:hypothetical protein